VSDGLLVGLLLLAVLLGVGSAAFLVMRSPAFWGELAKEVAAKAWPQIWAVLSKRNPPEIEKAMQDCYRRGGTWDNFRKRCRDR
jgi:hypothetical protein